MKIALAQIQTTPMDIAGNARLIARRWDEAEAQGKDIVFTPEQSVSGYPLEDRAINPDLLLASQLGRKALLEKSLSMECAIGIGYPELDADGKVKNVYEVIHRGKTISKQEKHDLPNTDVFDEKRIYAEGALPKPFDFKGVRVGVCVCEDTWHEDVARSLAERGAEVLISVNASPYYRGKQKHRLEKVLGERVKETKLPIAYVNQVGGVDEVVFDGFSCALNADRSVALQAPGFEEGLFGLDLVRTAQGIVFQNGAVEPLPDPLAEIYQALVLGTRDYIRKSGFKEVVLGMSGGIDSALVAAIAADAIGAENVHLVRMPSKYSSDHSLKDAADAAELLGCPIRTVSIQATVDALGEALTPEFNGMSSDQLRTTRENEQARTRGTVLMGLSNAWNWLVLSTGNKSEIGVGYCTLYGDMNGGFNPLKDVHKMLVYALSEYRNKERPAICLGPEGRVVPQNIIDKKPSAELAPGQFDEDSLPPYPVLDEMLERYVEHDQSMSLIAKTMDLASSLVTKILKLVDRAEYKRRQACPGVKITEKAFGKGRRNPIVGPAIPQMLDAAYSLEL